VVSDRMVAPGEEVAVSREPVVLVAGALQRQLVAGALPRQVIMGIHVVELVAAIIIMVPTPMVGADMAVTTGTAAMGTAVMGMAAMGTAEEEGMAHAMLAAPITITDTTIMAGAGITEGIGTMMAGHIPQPSHMMLFGCHIQT
jgi:type IV secretory pathway TrbL component